MFKHGQFCLFANCFHEIVTENDLQFRKKLLDQIEVLIIHPEQIKRVVRPDTDNFSLM